MADRTSASSDNSLAKATIAIYVILTIPTLFVAVKHGLRHLLGWAFLFVFLTLKMIGSGLALKSSPGSSASIVSSIGLSPLLIAAAGVLHEASVQSISLVLHSNPPTTCVSLSLVAKPQSLTILQSLLSH